MRKINKIVQSEVSPGIDSLWIHDGELLWFNNGKWVPMIGYNDSELIRRISELEEKVNNLESANMKPE